MAPFSVSRYDSVSSQFWQKHNTVIETMCRNIRTLSNFEPPATLQEIDAAAEQFVRKVSGQMYRSSVNQAACEQATAEISAVVSQLLGSLVTRAAPRDRADEALKARVRAAKRFATERG